MDHSVHWSWHLNEQQQFCLCLAPNILFETCFSKQNLLPLANEQTLFTAQDAKTYVVFRDKLKVFDFDEQEKFSIAVNAVVVCHYMAPIAAKSWYFQKQDNVHKEFYDGELVELTTEQPATYLVIESDIDTSTVMLVEAHHHFESSRSFTFGKVLKVHNDRLAKLY